ncbi:MAG: hypothetical protein HY710_14220 [Candidatus Latescibacteria bacterium]|nr:hypothetical protein [Candidatus Latescibacterota bacterium]
MNDDYLWDGSGEPDPEVEHLETLLSRFRYDGVVPDLSARPRRRVFFRMLAAAAVLLVALTAGLWLAGHRDRATTTLSVKDEGQRMKDEGRRAKDETGRPEVEQPPVMQDESIQADRSARKMAAQEGLTRHQTVDEGQSGEMAPGFDADEFAVLPSLTVPFPDAETASHIEKVQLLLRSFRNTRLSNGALAAEIDYEKQRARDLLSTNILLRRDAEAKGNLQAEELLSSLEPFLLDIANLQDEQVHDEVRSIKERMQRTEIMAELQIYSIQPSNLDVAPDF